MKTNEIIAIKPQKLLRRKELNSPIVQGEVLRVLIVLQGKCSVLPGKACPGLLLGG